MLRIYLSGGMSLDQEEVLVEAREFPGQQGREVFAYLVCNREGPVSRSGLADALWGSRLPEAWGTSLSAIVSKLRSLLGRVGLDGAAVLSTGAGCHELRLPDGSWIDHEAAADAIHAAESALAAGDPARAYGPSAVAHHIARRPFLPGGDAPWIDERREKLGSILIRALECRAEVYLWNGESTLAVETARDAVTSHPFRESAYRLLMRAHAAAGNTAEALRVYERCRVLVSEELGVSPSPETRAVHAAILESL